MSLPSRAEPIAAHSSSVTATLEMQSNASLLSSLSASLALSPTSAQPATMQPTPIAAPVSAASSSQVSVAPSPWFASFALGTPLPPNALSSAVLFGQPPTQQGAALFGQQQSQPQLLSSAFGASADPSHNPFAATGFGVVLAPQASSAQSAFGQPQQPRQQSSFIGGFGSPAPTLNSFASPSFGGLESTAFSSGAGQPSQPPTSIAPGPAFPAFGQPPQGLESYEPPLEEVTPAEQRASDLLVRLNQSEPDATTALFEALLSPSDPSVDADLCWLTPPLDRNQSFISLLKQYLSLSAAIQPDSPLYADCMRADAVVLAQLRRQLPNLRFGVRLTFGETVANRQFSLLSTAVSAGGNPHRRRFALELFRIFVTGPDWPDVMPPSCAGLLPSLLTGWSKQPDSTSTSTDETDSTEASQKHCTPHASFRDEAALMLLDHGVTLSNAWLSKMAGAGQLVDLLCFLSRCPPARFVSLVHQWKFVEAASSSFGRDSNPSPHPHPNMAETIALQIYRRVMAHCQRALEQLAANADGASTDRTATVLGLQSWLRSAASAIAAHPMFVCGIVFSSIISPFSTVPQSELEPAIAQLSWSDLATLLPQRTLLFALLSLHAPWLKEALMARIRTLARAPTDAPVAAAAALSLSLVESPLLVLFDEPPLSSALPTLVNDVIITLMCSYPSEPVWVEMLEELLQCAQNRAIELWPPMPALSAGCCSHPWSLLTRNHYRHQLFSIGRCLPVACLLHEHGVTAGERGESFIQHLCDEGLPAVLKEWLGRYPQFAMTAGWTREEVNSTYSEWQMSRAQAFLDLRSSCPLLFRDQQHSSRQQACRAIIAHAHDWMRSLGAFKVRRALLPHLIPDLHSIVVDYLIAAEAPFRQPDSFGNFGLPIAGLADSSSLPSAAQSYSAESMAELHRLLAGVENRSLSHESIASSLYRIIGVRRLEEEERVADLAGQRAMARLQAVTTGDVF